MLTTQCSSSDQQIVDTAIAWLAQGHTMTLITVAKTWGSSPRPTGSLLLLRDDGLHVGSVSGGCVEEDLFERHRNKQLTTSTPALLNYGVDREQAGRLGLPCGGRLELLLENIDDPTLWIQLRDSMAAKLLIQRRVCLSTGTVSLHATEQDTFTYTQQALQKVFGLAWRILIIGAGHLAHYVTQMATMLGYAVTVCDPRETHTHAVTPGVEFTRMMPDDAVTAYANHPQCAVVALSHDPKIDDMALLTALPSKAFYVGALGSRRNSAQRRARLSQLQVEAVHLRRLSAPIGLDIGSRTPAEIAISVIAEITAVRNQPVERACQAIS